MRSFLIATLILVSWLSSPSSSLAGIVLAGGVYSGTVDRWDTTTGQITTFSDIAAETSTSGFNILISSLAYNPITNRVLVGGFASTKLYELDATTGEFKREIETNGTISGLAVDSAGRVFASDPGGNRISIFNSDLTSSGSINLSALNAAAQAPSGLGFDTQGRLLVSTLGLGVFRYDGTNLTQFSTNTAAVGSVAVSDSNEVYIGSSDTRNPAVPADAISRVYRLNGDNGSANDSLLIGDTLLPPPAGFEAKATSPSGVTLTDDGKVVVGVLGRTNPGDGPPNGGLFVFDASSFNGLEGTPLFSATNTSAYSSVLYFSSVPEPTSLLAAGFAFGAVAIGRRLRNRKRAQRSTVES